MMSFSDRHLLVKSSPGRTYRRRHGSQIGPRINVVTPFDEITLSYDGKVAVLTNPLDMVDPKNAFTENSRKQCLVSLKVLGSTHQRGHDTVDAARSSSRLRTQRIPCSDRRRHAGWLRRSARGVTATSSAEILRQNFRLHHPSTSSRPPVVRTETTVNAPTLVQEGGFRNEGAGHFSSVGRLFTFGTFSLLGSRNGVVARRRPPHGPGRTHLPPRLLLTVLPKASRAVARLIS